MYMQQQIGSFKEEFPKNTFYRFLNSVKTNWLRFTFLLAADIVNNDIRDLTDQEILKLSDDQLTAFTADFEARLPEYLRNALHPDVAMA